MKINVLEAHNDTHMLDVWGSDLTCLNEDCVDYDMIIGQVESKEPKDESQDDFRGGDR